MSKSSGTEKLIDSLRDDIINGRYLPRDRLKIADLAELSSVSPGAVREGLSRLSAEGLVEALPQRGFRVKGVAISELRDLTEVRLHIERICVIETIQSADTSWKKRFERCVDVFIPMEIDWEGKATRKMGRWHDLHQEFHTLLTEGCKNVVWLELRARLYQQSERYRRLTASYSRTERDVASEHAAVAEAALAGEAQKTASLISDHIQATTDLLLQSDLPFSD